MGGSVKKISYQFHYCRIRIPAIVDPKNRKKVKLGL
jgi:hypothetical protein